MFSNVYVLSRSKLVDRNEAFRVALAIHQQVNTDFYEAWGIHAAVWHSVSHVPDTWSLEINDFPLQSQVYGRHLYDEKSFIVRGFVFAEQCKAWNESWSEIASHELLEMLADPFLNVYHRNGDRFYPREICDPVQGSGYLIHGTRVSNFVLPAYYVPTSPGPYDHLGLLKAPLSVLESGYSTYYEVQGSHEIPVYGVNYPAVKKEDRPWARRTQRSFT